jgi:hypothetical protein
MFLRLMACARAVRFASITAQVEEGIMREEIRLGNEALARNDVETAQQYFKQLLAAGGTPDQERIAANRLRDIRERQQREEAQRQAPAPTARTPRKTTTGRSRSTKAAAQEAEAAHHFVRPPETPIVVISRH